MFSITNINKKKDLKDDHICDHCCLKKFFIRAAFFCQFTPFVLDCFGDMAELADTDIVFPVPNLITLGSTAAKHRLLVLSEQI